MEVVLEGLAELRLFDLLLQLRLCFGTGAAAPFWSGTSVWFHFWSSSCCGASAYGTALSSLFGEKEDINVIAVVLWTSGLTGALINQDLAGSSRTCSAWCPHPSSGSRRGSGWCCRWGRRAVSTWEWSRRRSWTRKWGPVVPRVLLHIRNRAGQRRFSFLFSDNKLSQSFHSQHATGLMDWQQMRGNSFLTYIHSFPFIN